MAFTLKIDASAYKGGPVITTEIPNFPVDGKEAVEMGLLDAMYNGYVRSLTIAVQSKARTQYNAPVSGTRTKRGSSLSQAAAAKRESELRAASEAAANAVVQDSKSN